MKKLLKIVVGLLLIAVVGIVSLITFIDPNDYRGFMVAKVEETTGYKLELEGDLRWHIWPQISILVNDVSLTAPEAKAKMLKAENMRLDVEVIPLLSKQLSVKEVLLKGAVIRLTDDTQPHREKQIKKETSTTPSTAPTAEKPKQDNAKWSMDLDRVEITNANVVIQQSNNKDDLLNVRDINLLFSKQAEAVFDVRAKSAVNRNQQEITATLDGVLDLAHYPDALSAKINELNYQVKGEGFPAEGLSGTLSTQTEFNLAKEQFTLENVNLTLNELTSTGRIEGSFAEDARKVNGSLLLTGYESDLATTFTAILAQTPSFTLEGKGKRLNVDALTQAFSTKPAAASEVASSDTKAQSTTTALTPKQEKELAFLADVNGALALTLDELVINGNVYKAVVADVDNNNSIANIKALKAQLLGGEVSTKGRIDATGDKAVITLSPVIRQIDMTALNKMLKQAQTLSGSLNVSGTVSGVGLQNVLTTWQADLAARVDNARFNNINLQEIIVKSASLGFVGDSTGERYEQFTQFNDLAANLRLAKGNLNLSQIKVNSNAMLVNGSGVVGLTNMQCDLNLNVRILEKISGNREIAEFIRTSTIPVHLFGPCNQLSYKVNVDKLVKSQAKDQAKKALNRYLEKEKMDDRTKQAADKLFSKLVR